MYTFDLFEKNTGMRVIYEKTSIYRIGSLLSSDAKFYSARKVKWVTEPINVLGIIVSAQGNNEQLNIEPIIQQGSQLASCRADSFCNSCSSCENWVSRI